ncbi:hypothetical protein PMI18_01376 [Pseudomonas sp. GM102]|uniref:Imm42 family immunity protein n=1 Tax=Pseudomonas sp. GM102 TaxID=1144321 RepID=UPI00026F8082|nr:Imm42 family immunity protein [Pseudomonas sp. GM102]EJM04482.1 hypothetical protein PMI18_01376 [Pseudomonas sp. GM102]
MIFGDPIKFAILMEYVPQWSEEGSYRNGMFHFILDSTILPEFASVATLGVDVRCLQFNNALVDHVEDSVLFHMDAKTAFQDMLGRMLPGRLGIDVDDDFVNEYRFRVSSINLEEFDCFVFAVAFEDKLRIVGAKISDDFSSPYDVEDLRVSEVVVEKEEVAKIVAGAVGYYESIKEMPWGAD